jgi:DNA segregation ATPase FtsK/SpoIIIE-like protein
MTHTVESLMALAFDAMDAARVWAVKNDDLTLASLGRKREALRAALTEALEQPADCNALMLVKDCLMQANEQVNGPIVDTIWFSQTETLFDYIDSALQAAQPVREPLTDDPLQGAVDWFLEADGKFFCVATVQRTLRIGYNRAKRLADIAKERKAHGIGVSK